MEFRLTSVTSRIFIAIFLAYLALAVLTTVVVVAEMAVRARDSLDRELVRHDDTFARPIADALWAFDIDNLRSVVEGMVGLPEIFEVTVQDHEGRPLLAVSAAEMPSLPLISGPIVHSFQVVHETGIEDIVLGRVTIVSDRYVLFTRLRVGIGLMMASVLTKAVLLWLLLGYLLRHFLREPLEELAAAATRLRVGRLTERPVDLGSDPGIEFRTLQDAFNTMSESLRRDIEAKDQQAAQLHRLRSQLERRVDERTRALTAANAALRSALEERDEALRNATRAQQMAEDANRAKTDFLAMMSHELRTPLNAIIGFSEMITLDVGGPGRHLGYAQHIRESGLHLLEIINDILDLSKIEDGRMALSPETVSPTQIAESCLRLVGEMSRRRGVRLEHHVEGRERSIYGDPRALKQIIVNLLSNGCKFTRQGGLVRLEITVDPDGTTTIHVRDTGIGMDSEEVEVALERFGQVENEFAREQRGSGLGLPIVRSLVEMHGGSLSIDSIKGEGTVVTVSLPPAPVSTDAER